MSRTVTAPPTDRGYWRRLLRLAHPDGSGSHDLFIWTRALHDHVAGDHVEPVVDDRPRRARQRSYPRPAASAADRVPFDRFADFHVLTDRAVTMADAVAEPYGYLLRSLADCGEAGEKVGTHYYQQERRGATYRQLAAIGHRVGMDKAERVHWYRICESIPLSQRHASHIFDHVGAGRAA